jgi:hypothetical protein
MLAIGFELLLQAATDVAASPAAVKARTAFVMVRIENSHS